MIALLPIDSDDKGRLASQFLPYASIAESIVGGWIAEQASSGILYSYDVGLTTRSFVSTNTSAENSQSYCSSWHNYGLAIKFNVTIDTAGNKSLVEYSESTFNSIARYIYNNHRYDVIGMPGSSAELILGGLISDNPSIWYFEWHPGYDVNSIQDYRTEYINKIFPSNQQHNPLNIYNEYINNNIYRLSVGTELSGFTDQENLTISEFYSIYKLKREIDGVSAIDIKDISDYVINNPYSTYYEYIMSDISGNQDKALILKRYLQIHNIYNIIKDDNIKMPDLDSQAAKSMIMSSSTTDDIGFVPVGLLDISNGTDEEQGLKLEATFSPRLVDNKLVALDDDGKPVYYYGNIEMSFDKCHNDKNGCIGDFGSTGRLYIKSYVPPVNITNDVYGRPDRVPRYFVSSRNVDGSVDADLDPSTIPDDKEIVDGIPVIRTAEEEMITPPGPPNLLYPKGVIEVNIPVLLNKNNIAKENLI